MPSWPLPVSLLLRWLARLLSLSALRAILTTPQGAESPKTAHHVLRLGTVAFGRQRKAGSRASAIPGN